MVEQQISSASVVLDVVGRHHIVETISPDEPQMGGHEISPRQRGQVADAAQLSGFRHFAVEPVDPRRLEEISPRPHVCMRGIEQTVDGPAQRLPSGLLETDRARSVSR
jgi:hypothetical protein